MSYADQLRSARLHNATRGDQRIPYERDRDRVLYSAEFRRLAGVTQVASAEEGHHFHNRLTHSMKVAQIGLRLAQNLARKQPTVAARLNGISPDVVEAACLAHDLGHPPFGHVGETTLDQLVREHDNDDGFEGNAQSFRILTHLAVRFDVGGLDLTRATLAATLKYPWFRDATHPKKREKWSAYREDASAFEFARHGVPPDMSSPEAQLMDWADDIAYSVHDLDDFYRAGLLSWGHICAKDDVGNRHEAELIVTEAVARWKDAPSDANARLSRAMERVLSIVPFSLRAPYQGGREQVQKLHWWASQMIARYLDGITLSEAKGTETNEEFEDEIRVLKQFTWRYVIRNQALAAQQCGQRRILRHLFEELLEAIQEPKTRDLVPVRFRHLLDEPHLDNKGKPARVVADILSSMTEQEAVALHRRFRGLASGTMLDPIFR